MNRTLNPFKENVRMIGHAATVKSIDHPDIFLKRNPFKENVRMTPLIPHALTFYGVLRPRMRTRKRKRTYKHPLRKRLQRAARNTELRERQKQSDQLRYYPYWMRDTIADRIYEEVDFSRFDVSELSDRAVDQLWRKIAGRIAAAMVECLSHNIVVAATRMLRFNDEVQSVCRDHHDWSMTCATDD